MTTFKRNSIYTVREKEKLISEASKSVEKEFGVKRSSYARWICRDGYLFDISFYENCKDNSILCNLYVKPIYVDDLLWQIIYKKELRPFSLRITGGLAVPEIQLKYYYGWKINGDEGYEQTELIRLYREIYNEITCEINNFIRKNPDVNNFYYHNPEWHNNLLAILILCHQQKYSQALAMTQEDINKGETGGTTFIMSDESEKTTLEFVREYCLERIEAKCVEHDLR